MTETSIPKGLVIDFEFQSLIPPLSDDEFKRLEKSILAEGVRDPIITWNGTIIDGHNRYTVCQKHGIKFNTAPRKFASRDAAKIWIIENQFARRNLSKYDRSVLALQLEPLYAAEAKRRQGTRTDLVQNSAPSSDSGKTVEKLAKLAGTSRDTIRTVTARPDRNLQEGRHLLQADERQGLHEAVLHLYAGLQLLQHGAEGTQAHDYARP